MKIKLIASDLDGTLLTDSKEILPCTRAALLKAASLGCCLVPATGRAFEAVPEEVKELLGVKYIITSNGAGIYSAREKRRIYACGMTAAAVEKILELPEIHEAALEAFVDGRPYSELRYVENPMAFGATKYGEAYVKATRTGVEDIRGFVKENRDKLDSMAFVSGDERARSRLRKYLLGQVPNIYVTSSVPHMLEVGNIHAGKGNTLKHLLDMLHISAEEAAAFGDGDNDIDMLKAVKYGFAMGNGTAACKNAAAYITDTNQQDGVGRAVERFLE